MEWTFFWILFLFIGGTGLIMTGMLGMKGSSGKFLFAIFLILLGLKLLLNSSPKGRDLANNWAHTQRDTVWIDPSSGEETDVIFSSGVLVPSGIQDSLAVKEVPLNAIFGVAELWIPDTLNVDIFVDAVFSSCRFPDGRTIHFGDEHYQHIGNPAYPGKLIIRADVIFGNLNIRLVR